MEKQTKLSLLAATLVISLLATGCGGSAEPQSASPSENVVEVVNISYAPQSLTMERGAKVEWTNQDGGVHHTVTSGRPGAEGIPGLEKGEPARPDGLFDGDLPEASSTFSFVFDKPGTYDYFCRVHASMTATVIVK